MYVVQRRIGRQLDSLEEQEILDVITTSVTGAVVSTAVTSFILNLLLQGSISRLIGMIRNIQVIVHIMLIEIYCVRHAEFFTSELFKITSFELFDMKQYYTDVFDIVDTPPIEGNFSAVGYESSNFALNMGSIIVMVVAIPALTLVFALFTLLFYCSTKLRAFFRR